MQKIQYYFRFSFLTIVFGLNSSFIGDVMWPKTQIQIKDNHYWSSGYLTKGGDTVRFWFDLSLKHPKFNIARISKGGYVLGALSVFGDKTEQEVHVRNPRKLTVKLTGKYHHYRSKNSLIRQTDIGDTLLGFTKNCSLLPDEDIHFSIVRQMDSSGVVWNYLGADTSFLLSNQKFASMFMNEHHLP